MSGIASGARTTSAPSARIIRGMEVWATAAPLLCAAHCIAAPVVVAFAPRLAAFEEHERAVMGAALVLAMVALHGVARGRVRRPAPSMPAALRTT